MSTQKLSALEGALAPSAQPAQRDSSEVLDSPTPCALLSALPVSPAPVVPERIKPAVEDESADPVGDGHSDAELARRLPAVPAEPTAAPHTSPDATPSKSNGPHTATQGDRSIPH